MVNSNVSKKGTLTKVLSVFLASLMIFSCFSTCVFADTTILDYGECGDNLKWVLTDDGVLTISRLDETKDAGAMTDFLNYEAPWCSSRNSIISVVFSAGVTNIGNYAFWDCFNLTSITIPDGVTSIGDYAFNGCCDLALIKIPNNVTIIGDFAFSSCTGLASLAIPDNVTSVGRYAFCGCTGLTSLVIPDSVTSIGDNAFYGCTSLASIDIGSSCQAFGSSVFGNCNSVTSVEVDTNNPTFESKGNCVINKATKELILGFICSTIPTDGSVTSIGDYAFFNCFSITSIEIPDSVKTIGQCAFLNCGELTSVTIPNSVTSIKSHAFEYCTGLTSVKIGNCVTSIGEGAFQGCSSLVSITIPDSVTSIGDSAFASCVGLVSIAIGKNVNSLGNGFISECTSLSTITIDYENPYYEWKGNCIIQKNSKTLIQGFDNSVIPADGSVTNIGNSAFSGCTGLTSIEIPSSVTNIGNSAFAGCTGLTSIKIPNGVKSIGHKAFYWCTGLTSIEIPDSVTAIDSEAFSFCKNLTSITIPNGVTKIWNWTFGNCTRLASISIPDSVTDIYNSAFCGCSGLTSIEIPCGVVNIDNSAFSGCTGLTSIEIPSSVTNIGEYAFEGCTGLTTLIFNGAEDDTSALTSIGTSAFSGCTSLTGTLVIPNYDSLTIGTDAFHKCGYDGGMDNMAQLFSNYEGDFYHFSDALATYSNEYGTWTYNAYICNDCNTNLLQGYVYKSNNSELLADNVIFGEKDAVGSSYETDKISFVEVTQDATCMKGETVLVRLMLIDEPCDKILDEKEIVLTDTTEPHKAGDPVVENCVCDTENGIYTFDNVVYCSYGCGTEMSRNQVVLTFVAEVSASENADGVKAYYVDNDDNKYLIDSDDKYYSVADADLVLHYTGDTIHEGDCYNPTNNEYYFYNNVYCSNCSGKLLVNSEKVELTYHAKVAATATTNGTGEYFTDSNGNTWLWNSEAGKYEQGNPEILYGGTITADNIVCAIGKKTKIDFTYTGPSPEQEFVYKSAHSYASVTEDGYVTVSGYTYGNVSLVNVYSQDGERLLGTINGRSAYLVDGLNLNDIVVYCPVYSNGECGTSYNTVYFKDASGTEKTLGNYTSYQYFNGSITTKMADTTIAEMNNYSLSVGSSYVTIIAKQVGQTTFTAKAENLEGETDDYEKTVNVIVVGVPNSTITIASGETVKIQDYLVTPEDYEVTIDNISSSNTSVISVSDDGTVTGLSDGYSSVKVNGRDIYFKVVTAATEFEIPSQFVYAKDTEKRVPFTIDDNASSTNLVFEVISGPEDSNIYFWTSDGYSTTEVLTGLDFDYDTWNCSRNTGFGIDGDVPGDYTVRVYPEGAEELNETISFTLLEAEPTIEVCGEKTYVNFKYDNDTYLYYAVDENDEKIKAFDADYFNEPVYCTIKSRSYSTADDAEEEVRSEKIYSDYFYQPTDDSSNSYGYEHFVGEVIQFDGYYLGVTDEGYLVYLDWNFEGKNTYSYDRYYCFALTPVYSKDIAQTKACFTWNSDLKCFVETDFEGNFVKYAENPFVEGEKYLVSAYGCVYELVGFNAANLSESERTEITEDIGFEFDGVYLTFEGDCYPCFIYQEKEGVGYVCFAEEYGSEDFSEGETFDELYVCESLPQVMTLDDGEILTFDLLWDTFYSEPGNYTVSVDDNSVATVDGLTVTGKTGGSAQVLVSASYVGPSEDNRSTTTKYVTETVYIKVNSLMIVDDLILAKSETANVNAESPDETTPVTYTSSDENVATVDAKGNVTAVNPGKAEITVTCGDHTAKSKVIVSDVSIDVPAKVNKGDDASIDTKTNVSEDKVTVTYSSSDESIATVDEDGNITVVSAGTVDITTTVTITNGDVSRDFVTVDTIVCTTHSPATPVRENVVPATCTAEGSYEEVVYCTEEGCDYEFSRTKKTIAKLDHYDDDNDGFCDGCGVMMPGKGGTIVVADGDHYRYQISTDGINFKTCGNDTFDCPDGIAYIRVTNSDYKILVDGSEPAKNENGDYVVKVDGGEIITVVNKVVPDKEESLTLFEKIAQFFQKIIDFFKNIF